MKKIKVIEEKKVPGIFGMKTVKEEKILQVDDRTYLKTMRELERSSKKKPLSLDDMIMFDMIDEE